MTIVVASQLKSRSTDVVLYVTNWGMFPIGLPIKVVVDIFGAIQESARESRILVCRAYLSGTSEILAKLRALPDARLVFWAHLTPSQAILREIARTEQVLGVICLENNQRVRMIDNPSNIKSFTIPYGITGDSSEASSNINRNNVAFIGALVPQKGFHLLADSWPKIKVQVPNAKLYVFGSGSLYDSNVILGKMGIADEKYESRIFRKLSNHESSVIFMGNATSKTRNEILNTCTVGVVNPSGLTETFCLSAVEIQQKGIPVIGARKFGLLDTVKHLHTGYLVSHPNQISRYTVKLLQSEKLAQKLGKNARNYVVNRYGLEGVIDRWENFLNFIDTNSNEELITATKKIKVRSLQAIFGIINGRMVVLTKGAWPTQVEFWEGIKFLKRKLQTIIRRCCRLS